MVQQQKGSIFEQTIEESPLLADLRKQRQALDKDIFGSTHNLESAVAENRFGVAKEGLSKLDNGIAQYHEHFEKTIADLAAGLTGDLSQFVEFAKTAQNYTLKENFFKFFSKSKAERMRNERIKLINPKEGLEMVLDYGGQLVQEILEIRGIAQTSYSKLELNTTLIASKIKEYEPKEAALKNKLDLMESAYNENKAKYDTADSKTQAILGMKINTDHQALLAVRLEYDSVLTTYKQAQEAFKASELSRDSFEQMVRDLGRQAKMIHEKMENVSQIYAAAPEAVKVMMTTKGMESLDKAINVATAESVNIITESAAAVADATLTREEAPLVDPAIVNGLVMRVSDMINNFNERYSKISENARRPDSERYDLKK
ncbi:MAG: hypothetical protein ACP5N1_00620 [Candidatus Woesearchaeota archaeon]